MARYLARRLVQTVPLLFMISMIGFVIIQATVLGQWCFLCLVTAAISLILVYWAYDEVWASVTYLRRVWRRTHDMSIVWTAFCGGYHPEAEAAAAEAR